MLSRHALVAADPTSGLVFRSCSVVRIEDTLEGFSLGISDRYVFAGTNTGTAALPEKANKRESKIQAAEFRRIVVIFRTCMHSYICYPLVACARFGLHAQFEWMTHELCSARDCNRRRSSKGGLLD